MADEARAENVVVFDLDLNVPHRAPDLPQSLPLLLDIVVKLTIKSAPNADLVESADIDRDDPELDGRK